MRNARTQTIQVYNSLGQLVVTQDIQDNAMFDLRNLKDGMYYFFIDGQQMKFVKRK